MIPKSTSERSDKAKSEDILAKKMQEFIQQKVRSPLVQEQMKHLNSYKFPPECTDSVSSNE